MIESLSERAGTLNSWGLPTDIDVLLGKGRVADVSVLLSQAASRSKCNSAVDGCMGREGIAASGQPSAFSYQPGMMDNWTQAIG